MVTQEGLHSVCQSSPRTDFRKNIFEVIMAASFLNVVKDGNKDTDLLENGLEDMGRGKGKL